MARELDIPARPALLAPPQKLGFLPTLQFWNDWEAQRLLLPFVVMSAPILLLINVLQLWLRLGAWVPLVACVAIPYLTMGLVERYARAHARLRPHGATDDLRPLAARSVQAGRGLMLSMAGLSGFLMVLVLLQVGPAVLGAATLGGLALLAMMWRWNMYRARSLAASEHDER